jgi:hypothetical protein
MSLDEEVAQQRQVVAALGEQLDEVRLAWEAALERLAQLEADRAALAEHLSAQAKAEADARATDPFDEAEVGPHDERARERWLREERDG